MNDALTPHVFDATAATFEDAVNRKSLETPVLVDFWATWCGPCKIEIPHFVNLQAKYQDKGVAFLGLSVDDTVEQLRPFAEQYKINYPVLVGLENEAVQEAFGPIWGIPITFVIDRQGNICRKHQGLATEEQFERMIQSLL